MDKNGKLLLLEKCKSNNQIAGKPISIMNNDVQLTETQLKLFVDLCEIDPTLGVMYERCVNAVAEYQEDSRTARADISIIGHCVREIINRLPDMLARETGKTRRGDEDKAQRTLISEFEQSEGEITSTNNGIVQIPASLYDALSDYCDAVQAGSDNAKSRDYIVTSASKKLTPAYPPWRQARKFFMGYTHLGAGDGKALPTAEEVKEQIERIESALAVRTGHFFDSKSRLVMILEKTNAVVNGDYIAPTESLVLDAMSMMGSFPLRRVFYARLTNPKWLIPLDRTGAFETFPIEGDEQSEYDYWPESSYLQRCVNADPEGVADVLSKVQVKTNPAVKDAVVCITAALPAQYAKKLVKTIRSWVNECETTYKYCWDCEELSMLISHLLENRETKKNGSQLLRDCFDFTCEAGYYAIKPIPKAFPEHAYYKCLSLAMEPLVAKERVRVCKSLLSQYINLRYRDNNNSSLLSWYYPIISSSLNSAEVDASHALIAILISSLRNLAHEDEDGFLKNLEDDSHPIVKRACLFVLQEIVSYEELNQECSIAKRAISIANSDLIYDSGYEAELIPLVRAVGDAWGDESITELLSKVATSSNPLMLSGKHDARGDFEADAEDDKAAHVRESRWRHRVLTLIGRKHVHGAALAELENLDVLFGSDVDYSIEHVRSGAFITGPNSPLSIEEMLEMDTETLIMHLKTWGPNSDDRFALISHDGQGRVLKDYVASSPFAFEGQLEKVKTLKPVYVRSIVEGWASDFDEGASLPLTDFIALCIYGAQVDEEAGVPETDTWDDDRNNKPLVLESVRAIVAILKRDVPLDGVKEHSAEILKALIRAAKSLEPDASYEEKYGGDNMDPVTLSLNTIRPMALFGIACWCSMFRYDAGINTALDTFRRYMPDTSQSMADAGAMVQSFGWLVDYHRDWVKDNIHALFGSERPNECQQAALTGVLAYYTPNKDILELLRPAISIAMKNDSDEYVLGFALQKHRCSWLIGNWLYQIAAIGKLSLEDSVIADWIESTEPKTRGSVLNHICWLVQHSEGVAQATVEHVCDIWDSHLLLAEQDARQSECLSGIVWLVMSDCVDCTWWGPRLVSEIQIVEQFDDLSLISNQLIDYSTTDPMGAFEVLEAYVAKHKNVERSGYVMRKIAPIVLTNVVNTEGESYSSRIQRVMDALGSSGFVDLDEHLAQFNAVN